jgi:hypothetical protein
MTLTYTLSEEDQIQAQLFIATQSESIRKKRLKTRLFFIIFFFIAGIFCYLIDMKLLAYSYLFISILSLLLYHPYQRWLYKRHYTKFVKEKLKNQFNNEVKTNFENDFIEMSNQGTYVRINNGEIDQITEIKDYFYLRSKASQYLILPKEQVSDLASLRAFLTDFSKKLNIEFLSDLNWKWR